MGSAGTLPTYQATLSRLWRIEKAGIRLDLDPVRQASRLLGDPWKAFPSILIAGTNGKGSVAAMLSEILFRSGYKVGLYTSPHLSHYRERVAVKSLKQEFRFPKASWCRGFQAIEEMLAGSGLELTQFEILTLLAFHVFREERVDVAVLEVGLGGRLDATNIVDPLFGIIGRIDHDHHDYLGDSISAIAREKAGILRKKKPGLILSQSDEAMEAIREEGFKVGADLGVVDPGTLESVTPEGQIFSYGGERFHQRLLGLHQVQNGALALEAARLCREFGFSIPEERMREGLEHARWPVRFEILARSPCLVVDGAHNPNGAGALFRTLTLLDLPKPHLLLLGILEGKDVEGIGRELSPWGEAWFLCRAFHPKSLPAFRIRERLAGAAQGKDVLLADRVGEGLRIALRRAGKGTVCVAGSLSTAGEARRLFTGRTL